MTYHAEEKLNIQHKPPLPFPTPTHKLKKKKRKKGKRNKTKQTNKQTKNPREKPSFPSKEIMFALFFCNASQDMHKQEKQKAFAKIFVTNTYVQKIHKRLVPP